MALKVKENVYYSCLLAYPVGLMCWCLVSFIVVILGIPYTATVMLVLMALILIIAIGKILKEKSPYARIHTWNFTCAIQLRPLSTRNFSISAIQRFK